MFLTEDFYATESANIHLTKASSVQFQTDSVWDPVVT